MTVRLGNRMPARRQPLPVPGPWLANCGVGEARELEGLTLTSDMSLDPDWPGVSPTSATEVAAAHMARTYGMAPLVRRGLRQRYATKR